jgi:hypothetical protein
VSDILIAIGQGGHLAEQLRVLDKLSDYFPKLWVA